MSPIVLPGPTFPVSAATPTIPGLIGFGVKYGPPPPLVFSGVDVVDGPALRAAMATYMANSFDRTVDDLFMQKLNLFIDARNKGKGFADAQNDVVTTLSRMGVGADAGTDMDVFQTFWTGAP